MDAIESCKILFSTSTEGRRAAWTWNIFRSESFRETDSERCTRVPVIIGYDERSRECTMFHFGIYRHSRSTATSIHPFVQYAKVTLLGISPCQGPIVKRSGVAYSCSYALLISIMSMSAASLLRSRARDCPRFGPIRFKWFGLDLVPSWSTRSSDLVPFWSCWSDDGADVGDVRVAVFFFFSSWIFEALGGIFRSWPTEKLSVAIDGCWLTL